MVIRCVLPTWWLLRGGCTRSHSEHGRETPQRQWYSVLRRGRVGRCQVCKTQRMIKTLFSTHSFGPADTKGRASGLYAFKRTAHKASVQPSEFNNGILANAKNRTETTFCLRQKSGRDANSKSLLCRGNPIGIYAGNAGWSSPVARQAHNLKAAGSNPAPATKYCNIFLSASASARTARK